MVVVGKWALEAGLTVADRLALPTVRLIAATRSEEDSTMRCRGYEGQRRRQWIPAFVKITEDDGDLRKGREQKSA